MLVDSVWVQFESPDIKVTGGHRTVACVILGGLPRGGMILDIFATLNLVNNTSGILYNIIITLTITVTLYYHKIMLWVWLYIIG